MNNAAKAKAASWRKSSAAKNEEIKASSNVEISHRKKKAALLYLAGGSWRCSTGAALKISINSSIAAALAK
jgi:hypothetical protein